MGNTLELKFSFRSRSPCSVPRYALLILGSHWQRYISRGVRGGGGGGGKCGLSWGNASHTRQEAVTGKRATSNRIIQGHRPFIFQCFIGRRHRMLVGQTPTVGLCFLVALKGAKRTPPILGVPLAPAAWKTRLDTAGMELRTPIDL